MVLVAGHLVYDSMVFSARGVYDSGEKSYTPRVAERDKSYTRLCREPLRLEKSAVSSVLYTKVQINVYIYQIVPVAGEIRPFAADIVVFQKNHALTCRNCPKISPMLTCKNIQSATMYGQYARIGAQ